MTAVQERSTVSSTVKTAAATAARQRQAAERAAVKLGLQQLDNLPDSHLLALLSVLLGEAQRRGLDLKVK